MGILTKRRKQLADIIDRLPQERLQLEEEEHGKWVYNRSDFEIYLITYNITVDVNVEVIGEVTQKTYHYPAEFCQHSSEIEVTVKEVYEEENRIYFNTSSILKLEKAIIETLTF
tara:strand:+ start:96 stop:437 length:342 start_codon:yes stop_codon:yes gene_type:complete